MGGGLSSNHGEQGTPYLDNPPAATSDLPVETAPVSEERPSKRLKTAAEDAHSESNAATSSSAVVETVGAVTEPTAESQTSAVNDSATAQADPTNGINEATSDPKAIEGSQPARRTGIAPIKPEYAAPTPRLSVHSLMRLCLGTCFRSRKRPRKRLQLLRKLPKKMTKMANPPQMHLVGRKASPRRSAVRTSAARLAASRIPYSSAPAVRSPRSSPRRSAGMGRSVGWLTTSVNIWKAVLRASTPELSHAACTKPLANVLPGGSAVLSSTT